MLSGGGRLDVETGQHRPDEGGPCIRTVGGVDPDLAGRRMQLCQQLTVLVVGVLGVDEGQHGRVLQLPREGVGDGAPVGGGRGETALGEIVAVAEAGQEQRRVDGGDDAGDREPAGHDHLGHRLGLDGVPQLDDREARGAVVGESTQLGYQILAQGAAGAVVDQWRLTGGEDAGGVADGPYDGARRGRREVVVEDDAAGDVGEQACDRRPAGIDVQPADDHDRQAHAPPRFP